MASILEKVAAAVNEAAAAAREDAEKGVLKAEYKAMDVKSSGEGGPDGTSATSEKSEGITTAGAAGKLELPTYDPKSIEKQDTEDNTGTAAKSSNDTKGSTTAGALSELEAKKYEALEIKIDETKDNTGAAVKNAVSEGITTAGAPGELELPEYDALEIDSKDADPEGKLGKLELPEYEAKDIEIDETVDNTGESTVNEISQGIKTAGKLVKTVLDLLSGGGNGPETSERKFDHHGGFRFEVQLGHVKAGSFRAVDGLSTTIEVIEYQGGKDLYARQLPGRPKIAPVVLKKGYVNTAVLWDWMKATMDGSFQPEDVSVILMDDSGQVEMARYNLLGAWPSRWAGWQLDANGSNAMVEEMELQVREMNREEG